MSSKKVIIIDYGFGNVLSVKQGFDAVGVNATVTSNIQLIDNAQYLVLPGVGAFDKAMRALYEMDLVDVIIRKAGQEVPILGICLGMQMLLEESDERGVTRGLGLIPGRVEKFPKEKNGHNRVKIPQTNWYELIPSTSEVNWKHTLLNSYKKNDAVYFTHSYVAKLRDNNYKIADYLCGGNRISAMISNKNIIGCQFHPEKSGKVGLNILKSFIS